ncbi:MAG: biopolymer transporter ExbD [Bacteroidota bacterium]
MNTLLKLLVFGVLLIANTSLAQNNTLETETAFMNCVYESLPDKGAEFKAILNNAEQQLIKLEFLKDGSGSSYVDVYKNLYKMFSKDLKDLGVASYMSKITSTLDTPEVSKCMEGVFTSEAFASSKLSKMMTIIQAMNQYANGESLVDDILKSLDPEDFTHDYYRMTTFTMIESMNLTDSSGVALELPDKVEGDFTEEEIKIALRIKIDADQKITVNDKEVILGLLYQEVIDYLKKHKSKSVLSFETSKEAAYGNFIKVQTQIVIALDEVREEMAQQKHNTPFKELSTSQQEEIKKIYPLRIIENHEK